MIRRATRRKRRASHWPRAAGISRISLVLITSLSTFWVSLAGLGCGYHFVRYEGALGGHRSLAIPTLSNDSYDPGVEFIVAAALRREALRRGGLHLVENPDDADVVLSGRVLPIQTVGRSVSSVVLILEFEVTLRLDLKVRTRGGSQVLLDPMSLQETERYLASANVEVTRKNREEALRLLASTIASRVYDNLYAGLRQ